MQTKDAISVLKNFLNLEAVSAILMHLNKLEFEEACVLKSKGHSIKDKKIRSVDNQLFTNESPSMTNVHWANFFEWSFIKAIEEYNKKFDNKSFPIIETITALKYKEGDFYKIHTDSCAGAHRTYSLIYLLNNDYEGGSLVFRDPVSKNKILEVDKEPNQLILWPSNFLYPHEVTKVTKGVRYSVVSWAR